MIKVRGVFEIAVRDPAWAAALERNPEEAIRSAGLDFTSHEIAAVRDVVRGTRLSPYHTPPDDLPDRYPDLDALWQQAKRAR